VGEPAVDQAELGPWFRDGLAELLGRLRTTLPDAPTGTPVAAGTTQVEGSASDLLLWLWNRLPRPLESLVVTGDPRVVEGRHSLKI
jgi:hypothetical protein